MRRKLLIVAVAVLALSTVPTARTLPVPKDGVSCGALHASDARGVHTFSVRAVGVSCGLANATARVWTINDCGSPGTPAGNRVVKRSGFQCVVAVAFDPGRRLARSAQTAA